MGHLSSLPSLLRAQANTQKPLARQKVANLLAALDSVYLLLAPITTPAGHQVCLHLHHPGRGKTDLDHLLGFSAHIINGAAMRASAIHIKTSLHLCKQQLMHIVCACDSGLIYLPSMSKPACRARIACPSSSQTRQAHRSPS